MKTKNRSGSTEVDWMKSERGLGKDVFYHQSCLPVTMEAVRLKRMNT